MCRIHSPTMANNVGNARIYESLNSSGEPKPRYDNILHP